MKKTVFRTFAAIVVLAIFLTGATFGVLGCHQDIPDSQNDSSVQQEGSGVSTDSGSQGEESSLTQKPGGTVSGEDSSIREHSSKEDSIRENSSQEDSSAKEEDSSKQDSSDRNSSRDESSREESSKNDSSKEEASRGEESSDTYDTKYLIRVNKSTNVVTIYARDSSGKHTVPVKAMTCSTGYSTPTGVFVMGYQARWNGLEGNTWGQYVSHITGNYLFHTVPAAWKGEDGVYTSYYNNLGTTCSAGCIRLTAGDAYWMYTHCDAYDTVIEIDYFGSGADPLGKPATIKLPTSSTTNWDPTDPSSSNPWNSKKPYFTGIQNHTIEQGDSVPDLLSGVRGYDTCGNDKTSSVQVNGSVNPYQIGTYQITYSLTDVLGRTGTVTAYVYVVAPEESSQPEESSTPEESSQPEESSTPEESSQPEESSTPEESSQPEESSTPEESSQPEESSTLEESNVPEESSILEESSMPQESSNSSYVS